MEGQLIESYLQARDDSFLNYNRTDLGKVKINLNNLMKSDIETIDKKNAGNKCINVYLRIRGDVELYDIYEVKGDNLICSVPEEAHSSKNQKYGNYTRRKYLFTKIFSPEMNQQFIFNSIAKPNLLSFINGRNSTLFTYGASGSGKTYTIVGTSEEPGLIPRFLEYLFRSIPSIVHEPKIRPLPNGDTEYMNSKAVILEEQYRQKIISLVRQESHIQTYRRMQVRLSTEPVASVQGSPDVSCSVWVSFCEIYNENIYDLLTLSEAQGDARQKLQLGKCGDRSTYIKKLTYVNVKNGIEAYQILQFGLHNLNYAATVVNAHSSRSHFIFTIRLVQSSRINRKVYVSSFNFCDLAGSERLKKTMNFGDRLKESNNINTSLLVLGRCFENIRKCQQVKDSRQIPFRDSKLTEIFSNALLGYENVDMIVNINPSKDTLDETIHALNFSAVAKTLIVEERPKYRRENRFSLMVQTEKLERYKEMIQKLREDCQLSQKNIERRDDEIRLLQMKYSELKKENRQLKAESERVFRYDENEEIRRLNDAIDFIIEERDNKLIPYYEKKIEDEKNFIEKIYKERITSCEEFYKEAKRKERERLTKMYEERIAEMQVISIDSSDDESNLIPSPTESLKEKIEKLEAQIRELHDVIEDAKDDYIELKSEIERVAVLCPKRDWSNVLDVLENQMKLIEIHSKRCMASNRRTRSLACSRSRSCPSKSFNRRSRSVDSIVAHENIDDTSSESPLSNRSRSQSPNTISGRSRGMDSNVVLENTADIYFSVSPLCNSTRRSSF